MKLYWKIFLLTVSMTMMLFAVFGSSMMYLSFSNSFEYEVEQGYSAQRTWHLLFTTMHSSSLDVLLNPDSIAEMDRNISAYFTEDEFSLMTEENGELVSGGEYLSEYEELRKRMEKGERDAAYMVREVSGHHLLFYLSKMQLSGEEYYVGSCRNIDKLYSDRDRLYQEYLVLIIVLTAAGSSIIFIVSKLFTKDIEKLRKMARRFAGGDYSARSQIHTEDEIGSLSRDINRMADQLEKNIIELQDSLRRQEEFIAAFSHELKTPMTAIVGYSEMMRSMKLTEEEIIDYSTYICRQGKRLEKLSHQMLDLMGLTPEELQFERLLMPMILKEAAQGASFSLKEAGIVCRVQAQAGYVAGSRELLVMLFGNLLDNARKASEKGKRIFVKGSIQGTEYVVTVLDEGRGIPEKDIGRVTEAFYMVDKSRARKQGGSGLGLTLCKRIVDAHHGQMSIRSREGVGTAVHVSLPVVGKEEQSNENNF
ncbi:MAG: sensor histidine kinase [Coprococcus sp.]